MQWTVFDSKGSESSLLPHNGLPCPESGSKFIPDRLPQFMN